MKKKRKNRTEVDFRLILNTIIKYNDVSDIDTLRGLSIEHENNKFMCLCSVALSDVEYRLETEGHRLLPIFIGDNMIKYLEHGNNEQLFNAYMRSEYNKHEKVYPYIKESYLNANYKEPLEIVRIYISKDILNYTGDDLTGFEIEIIRNTHVFKEDSQIQVNEILATMYQTIFCELIKNYNLKQNK